jgi:hypothetical protein
VGDLPPKGPLHPEPLTHLQEEQYTRPHAGTGEGSPSIHSSLAKLREEIRVARAAPAEAKRSPPTDHHLISSGKEPTPMTVHAPRHKDMDPNHPRNLKKMIPKSDEYVPYPPPEGSPSFN